MVHKERVVRHHVVVRSERQLQSRQVTQQQICQPGNVDYRDTPFTRLVKLNTQWTGTWNNA